VKKVGPGHHLQGGTDEKDGWSWAAKKQREDRTSKKNWQRLPVTVRSLPSEEAGGFKKLVPD